tara:strand:+ start:12498 stop:12977 length:480 start_codon:yes stop_codon:yes gene_type:complete
MKIGNEKLLIIEFKLFDVCINQHLKYSDIEILSCEDGIKIGKITIRPNEKISGKGLFVTIHYDDLILFKKEVNSFNLLCVKKYGKEEPSRFLGINSSAYKSPINKDFNDLVLDLIKEKTTEAYKKLESEDHVLLDLNINEMILGYINKNSSSLEKLITN